MIFFLVCKYLGFVLLGGALQENLMKSQGDENDFLGNIFYCHGNKSVYTGSLYEFISFLVLSRFQKQLANT